MRLYLDTSVIGALFDEEMPERIKITRALLESIVEGKHAGVISSVVLEEIDRCPEELSTSEQAMPAVRRHFAEE